MNLNSQTFLDSKPICGFMSNNAAILGSSSNAISLYKLDTSTKLKVWKEHEGPVSAILKLSDEEFISGSWDSTLKSWSRNTKSSLWTSQHLSDAVTSLQQNSDGSLIFAGTHNGEIYVLCRKTGKILASRKIDSSRIQSLIAFNGKILAFLTNGFFYEIIFEDTEILMKKSEKIASTILFSKFSGEKFLISTGDSQILVFDNNFMILSILQGDSWFSDAEILGENIFTLNHLGFLEKWEICDKENSQKIKKIVVSENEIDSAFSAKNLTEKLNKNLEKLQIYYKILESEKMFKTMSFFMKIDDKFIIICSHDHIIRVLKLLPNDNFVVDDLDELLDDPEVFEIQQNRLRKMLGYQ